jgi:hypothetical protein
MGYRLPLDSQPWASAGDLPWVHPPEPNQTFAPLPSYPKLRHPNLLGYVRTNRGQLVWAGLTLIQAWIAAGKPAGIEILASYEPWSQVMGGILSVAGIEGFLENRGELKEVAADETDR